jgi:endonuclease III
MLCGCVLLSASNRVTVDYVWPVLFHLWPTPQALAAAEYLDVVPIVQPSGCQHRKANFLIWLSIQWNDHPDIAEARSIRHLPGCGEYAAESWRVFVDGDLERPCTDKVVEAWRLHSLRST